MGCCQACCDNQGANINNPLLIDHGQYKAVNQAPGLQAFYETKEEKRLSIDKKILLIIGYVKEIENQYDLFIHIALDITSLIFQYYTRISYKNMHNISKNNIMDLYNLAKQLKDENLMRIIFVWLSTKPKTMTDSIIKSIFIQLSRTDLQRLLQKDYITLKEERIFQHIMHWLQAQYINNPKLCKDGPREIMQPFLKHIRFPIMSMRFLSTDVYNSGLLTDEEFLGVIRSKFPKKKKKNEEKQDDLILNMFDNNRRKINNDKLNSFYYIDDDGFVVDDYLDTNDIINDDDEFDYKEREITDDIDCVRDSGTYPGNYAIGNMYRDDGDYWCSIDLAQGSDVWLIFDCKEYMIEKIGVNANMHYAPTIIKVYGSETMDGNAFWEPLVKKVNIPRDGQMKYIIMQGMNPRYIKLKFEDWSSMWVGITRIHFYE